MKDKPSLRNALRQINLALPICNSIQKLPKDFHDTLLKLTEDNGGITGIELVGPGYVLISCHFLTIYHGLY